MSTGIRAVVAGAIAVLIAVSLTGCGDAAAIVKDVLSDAAHAHVTNQAVADAEHQAELEANAKAFLKSTNWATLKAETAGAISLNKDAVICDSVFGTGGLFIQKNTVGIEDLLHSVAKSVASLNGAASLILDTNDLAAMYDEYNSGKSGAPTKAQLEFELFVYQQAYCAQYR